MTVAEIIQVMADNVYGLSVLIGALCVLVIVVSIAVCDVIAATKSKE